MATSSVTGLGTLQLSLFKSVTIQNHILTANDISTVSSFSNTVYGWTKISKNIFNELEYAHVFMSPVTIQNFIARPIWMRKNFYGTALRIENDIRQRMFKTKTLRNAILDTSHLFINRRIYNSLLQEKGTTAIRVEYLIMLDGEDVTDKVQNCTINYSLDSFVGTIDIVWADYTLYDRIDCSNMARNYMIERLEVYTRLATNTAPAWVLQGRFFLEKRTAGATYSGVTLSSWGRTRGALLSLPYSKPLTKIWLDDTTAKAIAQELCDATVPPVSLSWEVADYPILGSNIDVEGTEPIDVISTLATTVGGVVSCAKDGAIKVVYRYSINSVVDYIGAIPPDTPEITGVIGQDQSATVYFT